MIDSKKTLIFIFIMLFLCAPPNGSAEEDDGRRIPGSCTIFSVSHSESAYFGNNEDWRNPLTYYWVDPPDEENFGILCFGFDNLYPQGGINEKGLAFDANALPMITMKKNPDGVDPNNAMIHYILMQKCATVSEAIEMASRFDWSRIYRGRIDGQFMLADATGDAVVVGADSTGTLAFTRKPRGDGFLVSTNFNRAFPENRYGMYPCMRYDMAVSMLEEIKGESDLTVEYLASILDATHGESGSINTLYSNIFDLRKGVVYLYYWHDFDNPIVLDVAEIIARRPEPARIKTLFPLEVVERAAAEYRNYKGGRH